jgi:GAF domain-containing protein
MTEQTDPAVLRVSSVRLLELLVDTPGLDAFLNQIVRLAAATVNPPASCGLTMRRDGRPFTVATSDSLAVQVDEIQYGADEGPCLETLSSGRLIEVDDLAADDRWGSYRPHAVAHGVISSLSLPLAVDGHTVAALNLYASRRAAFHGTAREHADAFAAQCAAALTLTLRQNEQAEQQRQLSEAMASRSVIDQAIGVLMGQQRCTASVAFGLLREASQHRNRKLRDVATDIILNITGQPPEAPVEFRPSARRAADG